MTQPKIHAGHIEVATADLIGFRENVIVPNVSWGLNLGHECDVLVLDGKNRFTEVEVKISASDLRRDFKKEHGHKSSIISRLIYAIPTELSVLAVDIVPGNCGIITVAWNARNGKYEATWLRRCKHRKDYTPPKPHTITKFMQLGCMRIWSLKKHNNKTRL